MTMGDGKDVPAVPAILGDGEGSTRESWRMMMAKHTVKKAKRNPTDATMRNVRAGATKSASLSVRLAGLALRVKQLERVIFGQ